MAIGVQQTQDLVLAGVKNTSSVGTTYLTCGGFGDLQAVLTILTTSGTIANFGAWLEGSNDGENWWPMPLDAVVQAGSANATNWVQLGSTAAPSVNTTVGFYPIMLANPGVGASGLFTASQSWVGFKNESLPMYVRAAYVIVPGIGGLNFMIRAMVSS